MKPPLTQQSSRSPMRYKVAGFATGRDLRRIACTRVKMATLAPMPSEMVRMTVAAKPGDLRNWRRASLRSYMGYGREDSGRVSVGGRRTAGENPHFSQRTREMGHPTIRCRGNRWLEPEQGD